LSQVLLFGTAVYNGSVWTFSDVQYSALSQDENGTPSDSIIKTEPYMSSPSITRYAAPTPCACVQYSVPCLCCGFFSPVAWRSSFVPMFLSRRSPLLYHPQKTNSGSGAAAVAAGGKPGAAGKEQKNYGSNGNRYNEV
jgi:hypothetical protein